MINKDDVCFIIDRRYFLLNEIRSQGYKTCSPYIDKTIIGRIFREIWFRVLKFPETVWYNKEVLNRGCKYFFVYDTLITRKYLEWLRKSFPEAMIIFQYNNLVGTARHILPNDIPEGIYPITYDEDDSKKYGIRLNKNGAYIYSAKNVKKDIKYDVIFVGRDKGRAEYLLHLQSEMNRMGLVTKFLIMPNGRFYIPKKYYSKPIPYKEIAKLLSQSKAVLNIGLPGLKGATVRDYESIFYQVKLITNNSNIKTYDFYKPENVFILGERNLSELSDFLRTPYIPVSQDILRRYTLDFMIENVISSLSNVD